LVPYLCLGTLQTSAAQLTPGPFSFDYIVCDEGHKLKNPSTSLCKEIRKVKARHRLVLTGTPVQNNLTELWSIFDFIFNGAVLGDLAAFKRVFADPIMRERVRSCDFAVISLRPSLIDASLCALRLSLCSYWRHV